MSDTTKKPTTPTKINPPEGWKDGGGYFMQALEPTGEKVSLVRFQDVVQWLIVKRGEPLNAVMRFMKDQVQAAGVEAIYLLKREDYAEKKKTRPINTGDRLPQDGEKKLIPLGEHVQVSATDFKTTEMPRFHLATSAEAVVMVDTQKDDANFLHVPLLAPFLLPLPKRGSVNERLAISQTKAHELWGWGRVVEGADSVAKVTQLHAVPDTNAEPENWAQLIEFRKKHLGAEWSIKQKNIVANKAKTRTAVPGSKGVKEAMAGELGCSVARINKLIREKDTEGKKAQKHPTAATSSHRSVSASFAKS